MCLCPFDLWNENYYYFMQRSVRNFSISWASSGYNVVLSKGNSNIIFTFELVCVVFICFIVMWILPYSMWLVFLKWAENVSVKINLMRLRNKSGQQCILILKFNNMAINFILHGHYLKENICFCRRGTDYPCFVIYSVCHFGDMIIISFSIVFQVKEVTMVTITASS